MTERKPFFGFNNPTEKADVFKNTPEQNRFFDLSQILQIGLAEGGQSLFEISWSFASPEERESFPSCKFWSTSIFPCTIERYISNHPSVFPWTLVSLVVNKEKLADSLKLVEDVLTCAALNLTGLRWLCSKANISSKGKIYWSTFCLFVCFW